MSLPLRVLLHDFGPRWAELLEAIKLANRTCRRNVSHDASGLSMIYGGHEKRLMVCLNDLIAKA